MRLQGRLGHPVVLEEEVVVAPPVVVDHLQVELPVDARNLPAVEIPQVDAFELLVTFERNRDVDALAAGVESETLDTLAVQVGRASCRERV